jgi:hypothetical protein
MLHHRDRLKSALALALGLMAFTAPPAMAMTIPPSGPMHLSPPSTTTNTNTNLCSEVCSGRGYGSPLASGGAALPHDSRSRAVAIRSIHGSALQPAHDAGFDWGDAAIGAGAAAILLVVAGGATASRRGRRLGNTRASVAS